MNTPTVTLATLLALAIRKGKFYHLFFEDVYLESFYYPESAKLAAEFGGCRVVYLTCAKTRTERI